MNLNKYLEDAMNLNKYLEDAKKEIVGDNESIPAWFEVISNAFLGLAVEVQNTNKLLELIVVALEGNTQDDTQQSSLLEVLGLSGRTYNALRYGGVTTVADAVRVIRNEKRIITRGYGPVAQAELLKKLHQKGYLNE